MNMEASEMCAKDALTIEDAEHRVPVQHDLNSSLIVSSDRNYASRRWNQVWKWQNEDFLIRKLIFFHFLQAILHQKVKFCGSQLPHNFESSGESLEIKFKSDGDVSNQGFKLEYSLQSKIVYVCISWESQVYFDCGQMLLTNDSPSLSLLAWLGLNKYFSVIRQRAGIFW